MEDVARLLKEILPFSLLPVEQLNRVADVIEIEYFPPESDIMIHGGKPSEYLYIIQRGSVDLLREDSQGVHVFDTLTEGEVFGYPSLIRKRPPIVTVRTREETLLYMVPAPLFHQLRRDVPAFARFFASSVVERISHRLQTREANATPELFRLHLRDIISHELVSASPTITVHEAAQIMSLHNISSLVIESYPIGIVTDRDFRNRVMAKGLDYTTPVTEVMTSPVITLPAESLVFEGLVKMLEQGFHHMPITEDGIVVGIITHTDITRQQSRSPLFLPRQLERAHSVSDMRVYTEQVTSTVGSLLDAGARVSDIGRIVAVAHDALIVRLLRDAERELGPPPCPYGWLVLGSEGRYEQTLRTDQDNALVYADDAPPEAEEYFAKLADRVDSHLVKCGFPLCPGNIMATNPEWRQPLRVWQNYFEEWISNPKEKALLRVSIFFDYRQVYGKLDVEEALRPIIRQGRENHIFLGRLARVAIRQHAPISFFRHFVLEHSGEERDLLDLKVRGTALIVDLARLFALETGCLRTNTQERLQHCIEGSSLSKSGGEELIAAFELISLIRLRYQYDHIKQGKMPVNQVPVSWLSVMERRELKEALWAVDRVQRNIELEFQTELFG